MDDCACPRVPPLRIKTLLTAVDSLSFFKTVKLIVAAYFYRVLKAGFDVLHVYFTDKDGGFYVEFISKMSRDGVRIVLGLSMLLSLLKSR